ncbi:MAG: hypothetical protein R2701_11670 [Acidimicrobiales bacterium]|nr:hypothetical protein [Acidimicrobiales bacterium]
MGEHRTPLLLAAVAIFVVGPLLGLAYCARVGDREVLVEHYDDSAALVASWCDNVDAGLAPHGPFRSVAGLAAAVRAGSVVEPTEAAPTGDAEALDRWQDDHAEYVSSAYFAALEGIPDEVRLAWEVLTASIEQAQREEPVEHPADLDRAGHDIDGYRARRC